MAERLRQVLITYLTRRYFWLLGGVAMLFTCPLLVGHLTGSQVSLEYDPLTPLGTGYALYVLAFFIVGQGKRQFAHPRARLVPGFTTPHLLPIVLMMLTAVAVIPAVMSIGAVDRLPGMFAFCACLTAALIWSLHRNDMAIMLLAGVVYFSPFAVAGLDFWGLRAGSGPSIAVGLMVVSWLLIGAFPFRLKQMHEEQVEYATSIDMIQFDTSARGERARRQQLGALTRRWLLGTWQMADWWHDRATKHSQNGGTSLHSVRNLGFGATPAWASAWTLVAVLTLIAIFAHYANETLPKGGVLEDIPNLLAMPAMMLLVFPGAVSFVVLWQRWPRLETELLRPQRREDFVDYLHRGVAEILLQFDIALVAWFSCFYLRFLRTSMSLVDFLILLALALSVQVFALALGLLLVTVDRGMVMIAGYGAVCSLATFGVIVPWFELRDSVGVAPFLAVAALLVVVSMYLWRAARRRWLIAEFG